MRTLFPLRSTFLAVVGLALVAGTPVVAAEVTAEQRSQIESVVHDYLLNNPQVLKEALAKLEKHQEDEQRAIVAKAVRSITENVNPGDGIVVGNPNADVTLVEFFDYNCGYCKKALGDIEALVKADPRIRVVVRDFPILRPESAQAALVSIAVGQQLSGEKYFRFHSDLLLSKGVVGKERALEVAKAAGVDMDRLQKDMESDAVKQVLTRTMQAGEQLSLTGTPSFAMGDSVIPGAIGIDTLQTVIASVRKCGKVDC
ncbi:DsbA family protein [Pseudochelatococcus sp. G4_1912]|uniref:DsbA family protein n=1 Tax=Pseudochelatococcus sp. G4_1912 TaxID=3114288 RepID=UPI0039C6D5E7